MKQIILSVALLMAAGAAHAGSVQATTTDHYKDVVVSTPHTHKECTKRNKEGDALLGALLGGLFLGTATNSDQGAALGAIGGAIIGGESNDQNCKTITTYTNETRTVYSHSSITWTENGVSRTVEFQR